PDGLVLAAVRTDLGLRVPGQQLGPRRTRVVRVAVDIARVGAAHLVDPRGRVVVRPGLRLREPAAVAAVVLVAGGVDDVAQRDDVVGVAVAVLEPDELAVGPAHLEGPLRGPALAEEPADAAPAVLAVGRHPHDAGVVTGVADAGVDRERLAGTRRGVQPRQAVPVRGVGVHRRERAGDDHGLL